MANTLPDYNQNESFLKEETKEMELLRREMEQQGLRVLLQKKVQERSHHLDNDFSTSMGEDYDAGLEKHPLLDAQLFDGIDNNPNDPNLDPVQKREIENKQRDQKLQKQLQLQKRLENQYTNTPRFNPTPKGP